MGNRSNLDGLVVGYIGAIIIGWIAADFISGVFHWFEDRYAQEDWPLIGEYIAKPNNLHHADPSAFLNQGYWSRNSTTIVPAMIGLLVALSLNAPLWVIVSMLGVSQANEIHAWAHGRCNRVIRAIQKTGVIQSPRSHAEHHKEPHDVGYCVMTEWLNPVLDGIRFWLAIEWLVEKATGVKPKGSRQ